MSALQGRITAAFGRQYEVTCDDGVVRLCSTRGKKSEAACGDEVLIAETGPGQGVIDKILPRRSLFYRADQWKEKLICANVTQIVVVVATEPAFSDDLVTRCLCAAEAQDIASLVVLNKCDLAHTLEGARAALAAIRAAGHEVLEISAQGDVSALREKLKGHVSLFVGQSGMGKSTLTNALVPDAEARTREISVVLASGKHTTTHSRSYPLPGGGSLIDSPGLQSFGLAHLSRDDLESGFPEIRALHGKCRFRDCRHLSEPGCAIQDALRSGALNPRRYEALERLLDEHEIVRKHKLQGPS